MHRKLPNDLDIGSVHDTQSARRNSSEDIGSVSLSRPVSDMGPPYLDRVVLLQRTTSCERNAADEKIRAGRRAADVADTDIFTPDEPRQHVADVVCPNLLANENEWNPLRRNEADGEHRMARTDLYIRGEIPAIHAEREGNWRLHGTGLVR